MALKSILNKISLLNPISGCSHLFIRRDFMKSINHHQKYPKVMGFKKKFYEGSKILSMQEDLLSKEIKNFNGQTIEKWDALKTNTLKEGRDVTSINYDAKIIGLCITHKNLDAAKSFIHHIYDKKETPNVATLGKFMRLFYVCLEETGLTKKDEQTILNIYKDLQNRCPMFDSITSENVIFGLSLTTKWRECLNVLESLKFICKPSGATYSAIAKTAFKNNDEKNGWKLVNEAIVNNKSINPSTYSAYLNMTLKDKSTTVAKIEVLLNFFATNDITPCKKITDEILEILHSFGYSGNYTSVVKEMCKYCQRQLEEVTLTDKEFENLKSVFFNNCIIGRNIFNKTSPEELDQFKDFINKAEPYDMVIDGLNVAYSVGIKKPVHIHAQTLQTVVDHFADMSMRVLVLGRVHMKHWPRDCIRYCKQRADVFLAQNVSEDDPYLIYATMASGLGTGFLSRDFMRGHSYLLMDQRIRLLFRRWQQLHQHSVIHVNLDKKKVFIKYPSKSSTTIQKFKTGWHIPYTEEHIAYPPRMMDFPKNWLCIQKVS